MSTARELILARQDDPNTAILFEDERWTYVEYVAACAERAALLCRVQEAEAEEAAAMGEWGRKLVSKTAHPPLKQVA